MHLISALLCTALFCVVPFSCFAGVDLYTGTMDIQVVSGKGCAGTLGKHDITLVMRSDSENIAVSGYFEGQGITIGRFSGQLGAPLEVHYPLSDESRAVGHSLKITSVVSGIHAELQDQHLDETADDCNFDQATMTLRHAAGGKAAETRFAHLADAFESQLLRSRAFRLSRTGGHEEAVPLYEQALSLAERAVGGDSDQLVPYITGLANAYVKTGALDQFDRLYEQRFSSLKNEGAKAILSSYRIRFLLLSGKDSLLREDYAVAVEKFMDAYRLQPQNREAVAAVMMVHLRTEDYGKAIVFLETVEKSAETEVMRQDVKNALAQVYALRARKRDKSGETALAESDLKRAAALEPRAVSYVIDLARLRHKSVSLIEAEKVLKKGLTRFTQEGDRQQILAARDRLRQIESMLVKLRQVRG